MSYQTTYLDEMIAIGIFVVLPILILVIHDKMDVSKKK